MIESRGNGAPQMPEKLAIGPHRFAYRLDEAGENAYFWAIIGNYDSPRLDARVISRASAKIRKSTGIQQVYFCSAPAPEHFDGARDGERIECFNGRLIRALVTLGCGQGEAESLFEYVGSPSEWRGAMWRAATMAERLPQRTEAHVNLTQRIATVCRFMPMTMTVDGSFVWSLAVGNQVLLDAVRQFKEAVRVGSPAPPSSEVER